MGREEQKSTIKTMLKINRDLFSLLLIVTLVALTYTTLPRIDYVEPDVFFYFKNLPIIYHITLVYSIIVCFFGKNNKVRIFAAIVVSFLVIFTPSLMLVNPWFLDTYPFMIDAVFFQRNGQILPVHYLAESPALGVIFGSFLALTGLNPIILQKYYPALIALFIPLLIYLITEKIGVSKKSSAISALSFVTIVWPNLLHFCRQSISLIFYCTSFLLLFHLIFMKSDLRIYLLLILQILLMVMAHPATPIFFLANLAGIAIIGIISSQVRLREVKILIFTFSVSAILWIWWHFTVGTRYIRDFMAVANRLFFSLQESPLDIPGISQTFYGRTPIYGLIIDIRFIITAGIALSAVFIPIIAFRYLSNRKALFILLGWNISNIASAIPLLYMGLGSFPKPALFTFISWSPMCALFYEATVSNETTQRKRVFRYTIILFVILSSLLLPIIKYSPLPHLYPPTKELTSQIFLFQHSGNTTRVIILEEMAWGYPYNIYGINNSPATISKYYVATPQQMISEDIWITYRIITRDAFSIRKPTHLDVVINFTSFIETTHNKVYDPGWPDWILISHSRN